MRGRRANRARRTNARQSVRALTSSLHGHANRLRHWDPPQYNRAPFQNITIAIKLADLGTLPVTTTDVTTFLNTQLGLDPVTTNEKVVFKLQRVDAYANAIGSSTTSPKVKLVCYSLIPTTEQDVTKSANPEIKRLEDSGTLSKNAVVSYTWPLSQRDVVLTSLIQIPVFEVTTFASNAVELRVHVQWAFKPPA